MGGDHYSADEEPKNEPVEIVEAYTRRGRSKGRKFETFFLPSKQEVTIMYVSDSVTSSRWSRERNKSFYTQVAGKEFRSDDPKLIPPAVRKYLETYKPTKFEDMILVSQSHSYCGKSVEAFGRNFSCVKYGVRGDGTELIRNGDHEQKIDVSKSDRLIPYTKERWVKLKVIERLETHLRKSVASFANLEVPAMIKRLDEGVILDTGEIQKIIGESSSIDALWDDDK
jgi:hypothetical protein